MEYFGTMTLADLDKEYEDYANRPKCKVCGWDGDLHQKITYPWGEAEYYCDDCWEEMQDDED